MIKANELYEVAEIQRRIKTKEYIEMTKQSLMDLAEVGYMEVEMHQIQLSDPDIISDFMIELKESGYKTYFEDQVDDNITLVISWNLNQ